MKVVRLICVDCGLGRSVFTKQCPRCVVPAPALAVKVDLAASREVK